MEERYEELGLRAAVSSHCDYVEACNELAAILKGAYHHAPKRLQNTIFEDAQTAISVLANLDAMRGLAAANGVVQVAEAVLPRQKKLLLVSKFKHAAVIQQRRRWQRQESAYFDVPRDVLLGILRYLDVRSLAAAALVCRSWNVTANDEMLWKAQYFFHFGNPGTGFVKAPKQIDGNKSIICMLGVSDTSISWRSLFKHKAQRHPLQWFRSRRGFCKTCDSFVWVEISSMQTRVCSQSQSLHHKLKPLIPIQVVQILVKDGLTSSSSSSSDTDSEESSSNLKSALKLWTFPKCHPDPKTESQTTDYLAALENVERLQLT